ncbi:histone deacetylase HOS3, partial [Tremellales sp. Uapishka_1]
MTTSSSSSRLGLFIQPACLQHKYIRHPNSSHIFERPERLRAVLLGVAAAISRLEQAESTTSQLQAQDDLSILLSSLSLSSQSPRHLNIVQPPQPLLPGQILLHHQALQLTHSQPPDAPFPSNIKITSEYLKNLHRWASEAVEKIKETGSEIPSGLGLNQGDLYLGPGSILAIEGAVSVSVVAVRADDLPGIQVQTICQAVDLVCRSAASKTASKLEPSTPPPVSKNRQSTYSTPPAYLATQDINPNETTIPPSEPTSSSTFTKAFCAVRPPGHHCGEDAPSGFCYVNNVVVGAMHAYLQNDIDRAIIIDFDLHHGNGTQALVMPLNAASYAEDLMVKAGKPPSTLIGKNGKRKRGWTGFYGSVHDIYSYPCEDGDLDLVKDASISLAGHGQYIENIHLQPYSSEEDFYERIYPQYLALLDKAKHYMLETSALPGSTIVFISAGFDACEHEHQGMQRHDRRVPVSFFGRYTKDIASFADEYAEGKVVSVLEGGYSDRALTSAAMGHVIGMLGKEGDSSWWSETELNNIERATKKKRNGKLGPFPPELSSHEYLLRAHALLALFEGIPPDLSLNSTTTTPQNGANGRMTLRDRRKMNVEEETQTPPPPRRAKAAIVTPTGKKGEEKTRLDKAIHQMAQVSIEDQPTSKTEHPAPPPKIILRIPRPQPNPPQANQEPANDDFELPPEVPPPKTVPFASPSVKLATEAPTIYLPTLYPSVQSLTLQKEVTDDLGYRESSVATVSSSTDTEGEYQSAPSGPEEGVDPRSENERTMPGGFGGG